MSLSKRFGPGSEQVEARLDHLECALKAMHNLWLVGEHNDAQLATTVESWVAIDARTRPCHSPDPAAQRGLPTALRPGHWHILYRLEEWQIKGHISLEQEGRYAAYVLKWSGRQRLVSQVVEEALKPPPPPSPKRALPEGIPGREFIPVSRTSHATLMDTMFPKPKAPPVQAEPVAAEDSQGSGVAEESQGSVETPDF